MKPKWRLGHLQRGVWGLISQSASTAGNLAMAIFVAVDLVSRVLRSMVGGLRHRLGCSHDRASGLLYAHSS